ncbi:hypothetical protein LGH70_04350 [Hymenobacter sp. BT635]|uniref:DUF4234 domain-containing protein n=1 Tax=Hymenobacter nitidus TaxID=2880929 RepID=A0ABS8AAN4_9BACT|nr:hypothetical protein [Hymenobacter nitidus]MCB2376797.1 hypothetical protein [Hymenobacter nitidus]
MNPQGLSVAAVADPYMEEQHVLSTPKFIVLCVLTLGLYIVWWQYKVWRFFGRWQHTDNLPALRALLSVFTIYALLRDVKQFARDHAVPVAYPAGLLAAAYIVLALLSLLPEPGGLVSLLAFWPLVAAHKAFNAALLVSPEVQAVAQAEFNGRQRALLRIFGLFWVLMLLGLALLTLGI